MTQWLAVILHDDINSVEAPRLDILLFHCLESFAAANRSKRRIKRVIYQREAFTTVLFILQYGLLLCHSELACGFGR